MPQQLIKTAPPTFGGQQVFGDPAQFTSAPIGGSPLNEDAWLGLTPGTTTYRPAINGAAWAISGVMTGQTSAAVAAAQAALSSLAGLTLAFGRPTGLQFPGSWEVRQSCYFEPGELVWNAGSIVNPAPNSYQIAYKMILRQIGDIVTPS